MRTRLFWRGSREPVTHVGVSDDEREPGLCIDTLLEASMEGADGETLEELGDDSARTIGAAARSFQLFQEELVGRGQSLVPHAVLPVGYQDGEDRHQFAMRAVMARSISPLSRLLCPGPHLAPLGRAQAASASAVVHAGTRARRTASA